MQAKHAEVCSGVLFWTACTRRPHVLSLPSCCENSDSWRQARSVKTAKKVMNGTTMWSCDTELCTNCVEATKCWVFIAHFSIYSTLRCRCHAGTDINTINMCDRGRTITHMQIQRINRIWNTCPFVLTTIYPQCQSRNYFIWRPTPNCHGITSSYSGNTWSCVH